MKQKYHKKFLTIITFSFFSLGFLFINNALAGSAVLTWNANTESDLAGYKIYYGTSSRTGSNPGLNGNTMCGYSNSLSVGVVTTYTVTNLTDGQTYYFSVSAYDTSNNYGSFSSQVSKIIPNPYADTYANSNTYTDGYADTPSCLWCFSLFRYA